MDLSKGTSRVTPLTPTVVAVPCSTAELSTQLATLAADPRSLLDWLTDAGALTREGIDPALLSVAEPAELRRRLLDQPGLPADAIQRAYAASLGLPYVEPDLFPVDPRALASIAADVARRHRFIPLCLAEGSLIVAVEDPQDTKAAEVLALHSEHVVQFAVATRDAIERAITIWYSPNDDREVLEEIGRLYRFDREAPAANEVSDSAAEKPVVRLVHNMLLDAIHYGASDIHLRPLETSVDLLFRLDGALVKIRSFEKSMLQAVVSRIKIIGNMDIAEHRLPQDGRFRITRDGNDIDLRLSVIPMVQGESVVIRILNANAGLRSLDELGFSEPDRARFAELMSRSTGMVLVTGPTGCGKSTTLYAALQEVRKSNVNIVTVEDPVEYRLEGVNQIQVNTATGLTFARALRHILRHDPDVVMVGEIRDPETAKMAVESSLTGHLVLSTLHTNNAASAVTRMLEIGVEPYLVQTSLMAVLAQRLVRRNCSGCIDREPVEPPVRRVLGVDDEEVFFRGHGCSKCHGTGYAGRRSVYELLTVSGAVRELIGTGSTAELASLAETEGMVPLTENALRLARTGDTSLAEVYRVRLA